MGRCWRNLQEQEVDRAVGTADCSRQVEELPSRLEVLLEQVGHNYVVQLHQMRPCHVEAGPYQRHSACLQDRRVSEGGDWRHLCDCVQP